MKFWQSTIMHGCRTILITDDRIYFILVGQQQALFSTAIAGCFSWPMFWLAFAARPAHRTTEFLTQFKFRWCHQINSSIALLLSSFHVLHVQVLDFKINKCEDTENRIILNHSKPLKYVPLRISFYIIFHFEEHWKARNIATFIRYWFQPGVITTFTLPFSWIGFSDLWCHLIVYTWANHLNCWQSICERFIFMPLKHQYPHFV
jgi:hypothetical protein